MSTLFPACSRKPFSGAACFPCIPRFASLFRRHAVLFYSCVTFKVSSCSSRKKKQQQQPGPPSYSLHPLAFCPPSISFSLSVCRFFPPKVKKTLSPIWLTSQQTDRVLQLGLPTAETLGPLTPGPARLTWTNQTFSFYFFAASRFKRPSSVAANYLKSY